MTLLIRWFLNFFWLSYRRKKIGIFDSAHTPLRVYPNDLDLLFHVNNGRYFTYLDIARMDWLIRTGDWKRVNDLGWYPVAVSASLRFKKSLTVFQKFEMHTRMAGWDDRDFYIEHKIMRGRELITYGYVRARFLKKKGGQVLPEEFMRKLGYDSISPPLPKTAQDWRNSEKW